MNYSHKEEKGKMLLISTKDLLKYKVLGNKEHLGRVDGFFFSPKSWRLEHLTTKRGIWPLKKKFHIPVELLRSPDHLEEKIQMTVTSNVSEKLVVDALKESRNRKFSDHPIHYWRSGKFPHRIPWLDPFAISAVFKNRSKKEASNSNRRKIAKSISSSEKIQGYRVDAKDQQLGNVEDMIIDLDHWVIRYLIVRGQERKIMLPPAWVNNINSSSEIINLNLNKDMVLESPYVIY